jgi:translocation and assembly module TamA
MSGWMWVGANGAGWRRWGAAMAATLMLVGVHPMAGAQASAPAGAAAGEPAASPASAPASTPASAPASPAAESLASPAAAEPPSADVAMELVTWQLDIRAPAELRALLRNYLDLARFQSALQTGEDDRAASAASASSAASTEPASSDASATSAASAPAPEPMQITRAELRRLVAAAPDQVRSLLQARGHFQPVVNTRVTETPGAGTVAVSIQVDPGPVTRVSKVQILFEGELDARLSDGEAAATTLVEGLNEDWELPVGEVFRQEEWSSAKNVAMARLRAQGYPTASWSGTSVTVDPATRTARLFLIADSGPAFAFGPIHIEGLNRLPASAITHIAPFRPGDPYNERQVLDWQERIAKLALFDSLYVTVDLDPAYAKAAPVLVQLKERQMQNATVGLGVSSDTGPRLSLEHVHRNAWGLDWQTKTKLQLGLKESSGGLDLTSLPWPGRRKGLVSLQGSYLIDDDSNITTSQYLKVGQLREGNRLERTDYIALQRDQVRKEDDGIVSAATAYSWTTQYIFRDVDNQVSPTEGSTTLIELTGGRSYSALVDPGLFGRTYARLTWYLPFLDAWHATMRAEAGQVFAGDDTSVPDTLLFRAGGDESVRGYAYRSLGVTKDGVVVGGRSMATSSLELAHPLWSGLPALWGAVFVDVGDAASRFGNLRPKSGYGAGVRYRSPVGPLRLDVAWGRQEHRLRLHFSVGISL